MGELISIPFGDFSTKPTGKSPARLEKLALTSLAQGNRAPHRSTPPMRLAPVGSSEEVREKSAPRIGKIDLVSFMGLSTIQL
jgi:hypothetical protein